MNTLRFKIKIICINQLDSRKYQLKGKMNPINNKPIYLREGLTKADSDLLDYAIGLGCVTTSMNSAPQVLVKTSFGKKAHTVTDQTDVDELFTGGKIILRQTGDLKKNQLRNTKSMEIRGSWFKAEKYGKLTRY